MQPTDVEIVHVPRAEPSEQAITAADFTPIFTIEERLALKTQMNEFISKIMVDGVDYGPLPGGRQDKKVLMKAGAEKLCSIFGLTPRFIEDKIIEDWSGEDHQDEPLFYYSYKCQLYRGNRFMGEAIGSCNSREAKYRWRWVSEEEVPDYYQLKDLLSRSSSKREPQFAVQRKETSGKYGKPMAYWQEWEAAIARGEAQKVSVEKKDGGTMWCWEIGSTAYRIPNPDVADCINTCQKMGQKRALVAAVLVVTNCSDAFTQDLEEQYVAGGEEPGDNHQDSDGASGKAPSAGAPTSTVPPSAPRGSTKSHQPALVMNPHVAVLMERVNAAPDTVGLEGRNAEITQIIGELCDTLRELYGNDKRAEYKVNECYTQAFNIFGSPFQKPDAVAQIFNYILGFITVEEKKRKA